MNDSTSVDLVRRWGHGDHAAAAEIYDRYADRLIELTRVHLTAQLAQRIDPEDIVQSVCRTFFVRAQAGRFTLRHSGDLWRLLLTITLNKVRDQTRRHTAAKRGMGREQAFAAADDQSDPLALVPAAGPSPVEAVALTDLVAQLLAACEPHQRRMVELRLQGHLVEEIAQSLGCCGHTVLRGLQRARQHLERIGATVEAIA